MAPLVNPGRLTLTSKQLQLFGTDFKVPMQFSATDLFFYKL